MTEGRNFTKLDVKVVKLSVHDKFALEFWKGACFCIKATDRRAAAENGFKYVACKRAP